MPVGVAATHIDAGNVQLSFWLFAALFTVLLLAEIKIMLRQIALGVNGGH
jgi:cytochrome d ubiquinol oxidase subunit I